MAPQNKIRDISELGALTFETDMQLATAPAQKWTKKVNIWFGWSVNQLSKRGKANF